MLAPSLQTRLGETWSSVSGSDEPEKKGLTRTEAGRRVHLPKRKGPTRKGNPLAL